MILAQIGDVAILDVSAAHIKDDDTLGDKIISAEQKGAVLEFLCILKTFLNFDFQVFLMVLWTLIQNCCSFI